MLYIALGIIGVAFCVPFFIAYRRSLPGGGPSSDPKCETCSPWSRIEQRDLDTVHQLWLAERIRPYPYGETF
jgi:hypothetical protein